MINMREFRNGQVEELDVSAQPTEVTAVTGSAPAAAQAQVAGMLATIILGLCQRAGGSAATTDNNCPALQTTPSAVVLYAAGEHFYEGVSWQSLYILLTLVFVLGTFCGWTLHKWCGRTALSKSAIQVDACSGDDARRRREWDDYAYTPRTSMPAAAPNIPSGSAAATFRNQRVQGPVTYRRELAQPRYQPLAGWAWGSTEEATS
jgi:hypothetical protein